MKKQIAFAGVGVALVTSLVCQPVMASAVTPSSAPPIAAASVPLAPARGAELPAAAGDQRNIVSSLAKKALLEVLRHSISKVPAKIRPYVNKIIGVVEDLQQFQQTAVVSALVHAGVPSDVAATAAQWIILFLGL